MTFVNAPAAIGRFRLERRLGAGGFATVWLARDDELDSLVAVKVLADNWAGEADIRRRFVDEARLLRRVDSDRVVRVSTRVVSPPPVGTPSNCCTRGGQPDLPPVRTMTGRDPGRGRPRHGVLSWSGRRAEGGADG